MESNIPSAPLLPGRGTKPTEPETLPPEEELEDVDPLNEHVVDPGDPDGVVAEEERQAQSTPNVAPGPPPKKRKWPIVVAVILLLVAAVVGSYWYGSRKVAAPASTQSTPKATTQQKTQAKTVATKHYDSATYTLGLDYQEDWTISDTATRLNVQSPVVGLTTTQGKSNGRVVLTIQHQQTTIPGYATGDGAVAILNSEKLSYKKPTEVQRAQTYLSYLTYGGKGLDRLFLTGDNGYQKDQLVPMSDVVKGNPLVSVAFVSCTTNDCVVSENPTYLSLNADDWSSSSTAKQLTSLLESLQFN